MSDDTNAISDGYHTFGELYEHRQALFIALAKTNPRFAWRCKQHDDGTMYDGWFIAGMELPTGQISYHLPIKAWRKLDGVLTVERPQWDGHTSLDVVVRLQKWNAVR
jgi:hypothetical protein